VRGARRARDAAGAAARAVLLRGGGGPRRRGAHARHPGRGRGRSAAGGRRGRRCRRGHCPRGGGQAMSFAVEAQGLTVRYGRTLAVDRVSFRLEPGPIYGLIGRNGSGKTSLLSTLAAFSPASGG